MNLERVSYLLRDCARSYGSIYFLAVKNFILHSVKRSKNVAPLREHRSRQNFDSSPSSWTIVRGIVPQVSFPVANSRNLKTFLIPRRNIVTDGLGHRFAERIRGNQVDDILSSPREYPGYRFDSVPYFPTSLISRRVALKGGHGYVFLRGERCLTSRQHPGPAMVGWK